MQDVVRVGLISSISEETGSVRVYYPDRDCTTADLPLFSLGAEFNQLKIEDQVVVVHLSNDLSSGVVLGKLWGETAPPVGVEFYKSLGDSVSETVQGGCYIICAPDIRFETEEGAITLSEIITMRSRIENLERRI